MLQTWWLWRPGSNLSGIILSEEAVGIISSLFSAIRDNTYENTSDSEMLVLTIN